jgi:hypothetical protein
MATSHDIYSVVRALTFGCVSIFGVSEITPFVLSWAFGLASIYVASRMLASYGGEKWN